MYVYMYICIYVYVYVCTYIEVPRAEEIRLEIITTAEISTICHGSPRNFQTSFHGSPQHLKGVLTGVPII